MSGGPWEQYQQPAAAPERGPWERYARDLGLGTRAAVQGLGAVPGLVYDAAAAPINLATRGLNAAAGTEIPAIPPASEQIEAFLDAIGLPRPETRGERIMGGLVEGAASVLPTAGAGIAAAGAPGVTGAVGRALASQPAVQAASAGLAGGVAEATDSPLAGLAAGVAAPMALNAGASAVRRLVTPAGAIDPERARLAAVAAREGIPLTSGQATGSRPQQWIESAFEALPLTSGRAAAQRTAQQEAFNRAVLSRAGISASKATPEVLNRAQAQFSAEYGRLTSRNDMRVTQEFVDALDNLAQTVAPFTDDAEKALQRWSRQIAGRLASGTMKGREWQALDAGIGRQLRTATNPEVRFALRGLQEALRDGMEASIRQFGNPDDAGLWRDLRSRYSVFATVRDAMGRAGEGAALGNISPLALRGELAGVHTYAMGRGGLSDLARLGQAVLRAPPSSGTAERTQAINLMQGGGTAGMLAGGIATGSPTMMAASAAPVLAPPVFQAIYNLPRVQQYLRNQSLARMGVPVRADTLRAITAGGAARVAEDR